MFPREFRDYDNTKLGTYHQSVQSLASKVSCNIIALAIRFEWHYHKIIVGGPLYTESQESVLHMWRKLVQSRLSTATERAPIDPGLLCEDL